MDFPKWNPLAPHLALREHVRFLEGELSFLEHWTDRAGEWRQQFRGKLRELLGLPPEEARVPLDIRETDWVDAEGYSRTRVVYGVEAGIDAVAWVCVPRDNETPLPAVVCAHPRGPGKDELVGLTGAGGPPAFAAALAQRGYITIAPDAPGFGERGGDEMALARAGDLLGRPLLGMQVWELMRAVDYLEARPDVQPRRIGVTGVGMGGVQGLFAAAVDERLACAALSAGFSTWREMLVASDCFRWGPAPPASESLPGLLRWADLDDVACLIAPRALGVLADSADEAAPRRGQDEFVERVKAGFLAQGEEVKLAASVADAANTYPAETLFAFLDDWLKLPVV